MIVNKIISNSVCFFLFAVPVWGNWDPPAIKTFPSHSDNPASLVSAGEKLFSTKFNLVDGAGRPGATGDSKPTPRSATDVPLWHRLAGSDANSCAGCHNQPVIGGAGDFAVNAFVGAHMSNPPSNSIDSNLTNERNTLALFGAGAVEMIAKEMSRELRKIRADGIQKMRESQRSQELRLTAKGIDFGKIVIRTDGSVNTEGVVGVDSDLIIKPFGVKGVATSLREFTLFALNQHHGIQAIERFGWERTGKRDHDTDGVEVEFTVGQVSALVAFQATLEAPPSGIGSLDTGSYYSGRAVFSKIGCAGCHVPSLPLEAKVFVEPNEYNRPGAMTPDDVENVVHIIIPVKEGTGVVEDGKGGLTVSTYTDFKRHRICDEDIPFLCNEKIRQDDVPTDQFLTAKLWNLAVSAPYCHRGDCSTISEAILVHGGEARESRDKFVESSENDKRMLIAFLLSLGARGN